MTARDAPLGQREPPIAVRCSDLSKDYGLRPAIRNLRATIRAGESVAIFGDNGAGKSTLLQLLSGLLRPSRGRVGIMGGQPWGRAGARIRAQIGVLSHQSHLYEELSPRDNLTFYARLYGASDPQDRADDILRRFGLASRSNDPVRTLSRGMTQRVSLMRALIHGPRLLLLDEPDTGLDADSRAILASHVANQGEDTTVVMATHNVDMGIEMTRRAIVLREGGIVYDSSADGGQTEDGSRRRDEVVRHLVARER